jgi:hypothetical protein
VAIGVFVGGTESSENGRKRKHWNLADVNANHPFCSLFVILDIFVVNRIRCGVPG